MTKIEGTNEMTRAEVIREIRIELAACAEKRANISEVVSALKGRIKAELGMTIGQWNMMNQLADMEAGKRADLFAAIREGFDALSLGTQTSFLDVLERPSNVVPMTRPAPEAPAAGSVAERIAAAVLEDKEAGVFERADARELEDA